jgi:GTP-binding protein
MSRKPIIALVGRPNVGKSTLFNRILGRREAIVNDFPGVTRDRHYAESDHCGRAFVLVDTGGFDPEATEGMLSLMKIQVELALEEADALVFVLDCREGLTGTDEVIWEMLRRSSRRVYVAVNKVDKPSLDPQVADFYRLGMAELFPMTAERGSGVAELLDHMLVDLDAPALADDELDQEAVGPCKIAIVGRPNVGKSTFANALLGEERYLTSDVAGTTRDAIDTPFQVGGRDYLLIDTAGIRRRKNVEAGLERMSVARTIQAIERAHIVTLVIDASEGLTDQDKKLAALVLDRGRGLVVIANKWDLLRGEKIEETRRALDDESTFFGFAPRLNTSALNGLNVKKFLPIVDRVHRNLFFRIATSELNRFYEQVVQTHPPHVAGSKSVRIRYLVQVQVNPPTILLFKGGTADVPANYLRFLQREFRSRYDFEGVPVILVPK